MSKKSKKRQHRCGSINEYRNILYIYNPTSNYYFQQKGWHIWMKIGNPVL